MVPDIGDMTGFFAILVHFLPFNPVTVQKAKILKT